ncbi:hypothetical protein QQP08_026556 [Theobroma cacao]|nr:hypothetical protein QQP08_026556 [Theobroma cacao]
MVEMISTPGPPRPVLLQMKGDANCIIQGNAFCLFPMDDEELGAYTLDEALAMVGFGKFQGLVLAYAGLGWFAEAMEIMILSFIGAAVKSEWGLSPSQESLLTTVVFAGMLIGAYSWGLISDNYGRRHASFPSHYIPSISVLYMPSE